MQLIPTNLTMSSLEMVEFINAERKGQAAAVGSQFPSTGYAKLEHSDFMKKVPQVLGGGAGNFSDTYVHPQNGQHYPCYRLPKREACLMAMSYSYELQAKVFDRMTALENKAAPALPNFADPVAAARAWADAKEAEQKAVAALELAAPKVEFVDRYVESQGSMTFRQVAKPLRAMGLPAYVATHSTDMFKSLLIGAGSKLSNEKNQLLSMNSSFEKSAANTQTAQQVRRLVRKPVRNHLKEIAQ